MTEKLNKAIELRSQKNYSNSEKIFIELINDYPKNAKIYYHYAWLCDNMEREIEARPKYEKALELGLNGEDLKGCYLGLGSTYRCIGEYEKSITLFNIAIKKFPLNNEYKVFKAMALYNVENHQEAMNLLLNVVAKTSIDKGIQEYQKAIEYYSDKLEKKFI
ncbi:tetratricopeptide repeat protein [Tenacibaculum ovolyticum]|uniref:tetratricopeptide repeat protein n=1 Tax=Tenacibaculum ovolyticum TaxID=104270 RepID=UPI00041416F1|nr:tetratricopeptide repeat protein [Tenacibaculum ovolyticum]